MTADSPVPVDATALRRAWLRIRDPFATPPKSTRTALLLAWLAWFPPGHWGGGSLHLVAPAAVAVLAAFLVHMSVRARRRAAALDGRTLRQELEKEVRKNDGMALLMLLMAGVLLAILAALLVQLLRRSQPLRVDDLAVPSLGVLILWGSVETARCHRRLPNVLRP